jgi:heat shock protein HslJ
MPLKMISAALLALTCVSACATPQPPADITGASLAGTSWRQISPELPAGVQAPTITFGADGRAAGYAGCNQWFASVTSDAGGNLRFGAIGATRRMCEPAAMEVERIFLDGLEHTTAVQHDANARTIRLIGDEAEDRGTFEAWTPPAR